MAQAVHPLHPHKVPERRPARLRELGIYELPGRGEYVASTLYSDGCCLYSLTAWWNFGVAEYRADKDGRLISRGTPTGLRVRDLRDTGQSATYPKPRIL